MKVINNPINETWYADPEARYYNGKYYIYVTQSFTEYERQLNIDVLCSEDLVHWEQKRNIIDMSGFPWIRRAVWAPTVIEKDNLYYMIFASNDIHSDGEGGGLEIAVSEKPEGPFCSYLKKELIDSIINDAQPIDAHLFKDDDGTVYLYYGGWGHCNIAIMNSTMTGFSAFETGELFREITPENYTEGPCVLKKDELYYMMWSSGNWQDESYEVRYGISDSPIGPFIVKGVVLKSDEKIARGPGHNGYFQIADSDDMMIVYHRRPLDANEAGCRVLCIDKLPIENGNIIEVKMTRKCIID